MSTSVPITALTIPEILRKVERGEKLVATTAYDYTMGTLVDAAGVDIVLVGDSLGSVVQGMKNTLPVTLDEIIYHSRLVVRAVQRALVIGDLPFLSYQPSVRDAVFSAGRLMKEGGVSAVKLEGGAHFKTHISEMVQSGIPVVGHVGLMPQHVHRIGGFRVQGTTEETAKQIVEDAVAVETAGAFAVVLEGVPEEVAVEVTRHLKIPTIGIGACPECSGQILVVNDLIGLVPVGRIGKPRFAKEYEHVSQRVLDAVQNFAQEVRDGNFPSSEFLYRKKK